MSLNDVVRIEALETGAGESVSVDAEPLGTTPIHQLTEADIFKEGSSDDDLRRLMIEMAAAGDPTGGLSADTKPTQRPKRSPFHGVTLVYSRKCLWQAMIAMCVDRKIATVEVNEPGDYPGESAAAMNLIKTAPSTVVINAGECARKLAEIAGVSQVVSCVESPLSIEAVLDGTLNDKIIEESFDGLYAWLGMSPTGVYISEYMRIAAGIGSPSSIYSEINVADARHMVTGLRMSGLVRDDGTGGDSPRWAVGDIRTMTFGARGFDNINNFIVVGQTLETHRTREFKEFVLSAPTHTFGDVRCMLINCHASETTRVLTSALPVHAVLFFTQYGELWHCELRTGSVGYESKDELGQPINVIHYLATGLEMDGSKIISIEEQTAVFNLDNDELARLLSMK